MPCNVSSETREPTEPTAPADTAAYIAWVSAEMARLASAANLDVLAYFLGMAQIEAADAAARATTDAPADNAPVKAK